MNSPQSNSPTSRPQLSRRQFSQMLAATAAFAFSRNSYAQTKSGPSMLLAASDPFCGLDILRMRYAAGRRPSDDISGNALSWLLTRQESFAQKALAEMRQTTLPKAGSRYWTTYASWALAFDWLYEHPDFDAALKDRVAQQLLDGAIATAATPDLQHPDQASYHNYTTRFLGLTTFTICAVAKRRPDDPRVKDLKDKCARAFQNILQGIEPGLAEGQLSRVDGLHAHLVCPHGHARRVATHHHGRRSRASLWHLQELCRYVSLQADAGRHAFARGRQRVSDPR